MPFFIQPFFRKPFKLFAIDADTGQPIDPNVRKKTRVTYYELETGSNGSKRLIAHKTPSQVSKQAEEKAEDTKKPAEEAKKDEDPEDKPWTEAQDKTIIAMKGENRIWVDIAKEVGRAKHEVQARWKEINPNKGKNEDAGKKDNGGGGGNNQGEQAKENKSGNEQANGQGQGKKNKGNNQNNNQNNKNNQQNKQNNNQQKNANKQSNNNKNNDKNKTQNANNNQNNPTSKPASKQPTNNKPTNNGEARFTMNDWLTLQEDDIFSFGELQCLSELIAKDMNQGWQRVAAKFFDLTGRRVHPDDVREKFESMAVAAAGGKK
jgi:hypothetical protein